MPLTIKGGPCSNTKCVTNYDPKKPKILSIEDLKSSNQDKARITSHSTNAGSELNNHTTQEGIRKDLEAYSQIEIMEDLEVNSYKEVMLNEPNKNKDQTSANGRVAYSESSCQICHA